MDVASIVRRLTTVVASALVLTAAMTAYSGLGPPTPTMALAAASDEEGPLRAEDPLRVLSGIGDGQTIRPPVPGETTSIWHIPHPDDETIGMAGALAAEAAAGRRNIVVFYTNGEASDVRLVLNGLVYCTLHGRYHDPDEEGYEPLDKAAFTRARLRETQAALARLGVAPEDVLNVGLPDGRVTVDAAYEVMRTLDELFPHAAHRTTALTDPHPDHRNLARALYRLVEARRQGDARYDDPQRSDAFRSEPDVAFFSVYAYERRAAYRHLSWLGRPVLTRHAVPDAPLKAKALAEFAVWAPHEGRFAIGMHSVPRLLREASHDAFEYMVPASEVSGLRYRLRRHTDITLFQNKAAMHVALTERLQLRLGVTFAGDIRPPTVLYELPTMINAVALRVGVSPTDWRFARARVSVAGVHLFNRVLLEYAGQGLLRIGWKFDL